jgi:hypothetical protein
MVISIPQEPLPSGGSGGLPAPGIVPLRDPRGLQVQQLGRSMQAAGFDFAQVANTLQNDLDEAKTSERLSIFDDAAEQTSLHPETGFLNQRGGAASLEARAEALKSLEAQRDKLEGTLDNDVQRGMFREQVGRRMTEITGQYDRHTANQIQAYKLGQDRVRGRQAIGLSVEAQVSGDPAAALRHLNTAKLQARTVAERLEQSPEEVDEAVQEATTLIHAGVVDRYLAEGQTQEAADYLQGVDKEEIAPGQRADMQDVVRRATLKQKAEDMALDILDEASSAQIGAQVQALGEALGMRPPGTAQPARRLNSEQLRRRSLEILDGKDLPIELQTLVRDRIDFRVQERARAEAVEANSAMTEAETILTLPQNRGMKASQLSDNLQERLIRAGKWADIVKFAETLDYPNDLDTWESISTMTDAELRVTDREVFLDLIRGNLSETQANQAMTRWRTANNEATAADKSRSRWMPMVSRAAVDIGVLEVNEAGNFFADKPGVSWPRVFRIQAEVEKRVDDFVRLNGKEPPREELQKIVGEVFADDVYSTLGTNITLPISALSPEELADATEVVGPFTLNAGVYDRLRDAVGLSDKRAEDMTIDERRVILELWRDLRQPDSLEELDERTLNTLVRSIRR